MMWKCEKGHASTVLALAAVPTILAAGAAVDYSRGMQNQAHLQAAVDAAALAAASHNGTTAQRTAAAQSAFTRNVDIGACTVTPSVTFAGNNVTVSAACEMETSFMALAGLEEVALAAAATAIKPPQQAGRCVIALEPSEKEAVFINSDSSIHSPDCEVQVNSTNDQALRGDGNGDIVAKKNCVVGGWIAGSGSTFTPAPVSCPVLTDPLAALAAPTQATAACNYTDRVISTNTTINPGVYCKKTEIKDGAQVTLNPGIYVFRNGELIVNNGSSISGNGVMLYFTGTDNARFNLNSGSHIAIEAPTTGTYAGIAIFQQRGITADYSILNSDSTSSIEGVIFLPSTALHLNSYGELSSSTPWTIVVADKVQVNSHSVLRLNANYAASTVPVPAALAVSAGKVRLTQ